MQMRKIAVVMAVLVGFACAPLATRAIADEGREPAAADSNTAKHKKKKKKKTKAKKHGKKATRQTRSHKPSTPSSGGAAGAGSHYPTQPGGSGFSDIPNEKKDDLPPPSTPPN